MQSPVQNPKLFTSDATLYPTMCTAVDRLSDCIEKLLRAVALKEGFFSEQISVKRSQLWEFIMDPYFDSVRKNLNISSDKFSEHYANFLTASDLMNQDKLRDLTLGIAKDTYQTVRKIIPFDKTLASMYAELIGRANIVHFFTHHPNARLRLVTPKRGDQLNTELAESMDNSLIVVNMVYPAMEIGGAIFQKSNVELAWGKA